MKTLAHSRLFSTVSVLMFLFLFLPGPSAKSDTIYVRASAAGTNNGTSWTDAFVYLQDALAAAVSGDEIWIAQGTYKPDLGTGITPGSRSATFLLKNGVAVYGGFPVDGGDWNSRNISVFVTILSGDLSGNDGADFVNNSENSYHVVTGSGASASAILDGFIITAGFANGTNPNDRGAGMYSSNGQAIIRDCTFSANKAIHGGGMTCETNSNMQLTQVTFSDNRAGDSAAGGGLRIIQSSPSMTDCVFSGNKACYGAGLHASSCSSRITRCRFLDNIAENYGNGGGMYLYGAQTSQSRPMMVGCIFFGNQAMSLGGGLYSSFYTYPYLANCLFINNKGVTAGGGVFSSEGGPKLTNCVFSGNKTGTSYYASGGGFHNDYLSTAELRNCTFAGNSSYAGGGMYVYYSTVTLANNVFWGNTAANGAQLGVITSGSLSVSYCDVQGGQAGVYVGGGTLYWYSGNINTDPLFVDADGTDNIIGTPDDNLHLGADSPAADAAYNSGVMADSADLDTDGNTTEAIPWDYDLQNRFVDDPAIANTGSGTPPLVDMGAYERSGASCGDAAHQPPPGDLNHDCRVNNTDLAQMAGYWLDENCTDPEWCGGADLDSLGSVNLNDFVLFAVQWLVCTAPECD